MIVGNYLIVTFIVIITIVVLQLGATLYLLSRWCTNKVNLGIVKDLLLLVVR